MVTTRRQTGFRPYKNLSQRSGVKAYRVRSNALAVQFKNNSVYRYDKVAHPARTYNKMVRYAKNGKYLNRYLTGHTGRAGGPIQAQRIRR